MYVELDQLYNSSTIRNNFSQEKLFNDLLAVSKAEPLSITIKKDTLFSKKLDLDKQICFLVEGITCSYFRGTPSKISASPQFLNLELVLGMESMDIEAFTTCKVLIFSRLDIMEYLFSMQEGVLFLFQYEKEKKDFLIHRVKLLHQKGYVRLLQVMQEVGKECGEQVDNECILPKCFTIKRLAALASLSTHTVSLIHEKMIQEKQIRKEGGRIILLEMATD
ncbi:Crp/Fnr family transcriptional regulator [Listeria booriae]|uniref:Crp/Fnr family transcriptional regulator n=2 Tax=Listeria booriae TaxID=1552123 RepID=A0A7X0WQK5_9LIST|nr:Crp/Fnr family transcriptional regulator [Listeria booriae]MBC1357953.1 Crp/Fnr family transcriptional regulator [Listeria booriae]MBC1373415.1 Crp/Fnr family transcriptional regulator [Listeria booriae]